MLGLWLCIISFIVMGISWLIAFCAYISNEEDDIKKALKVAYVSGIICIFCTVGIVVKNFQPAVRDKEPYKVQYLYSLEDNNLVNGRGYYRSVRIETDLYYQYIYKSGSGYKYHKVKASKTTIFEDDTTPRVEFYEVHQKWFIFENVYDCYRIYVPEATIKENYNIDLG